jgi:cold shock CspA family protein
VGQWDVYVADIACTIACREGQKVKFETQRDQRSGKMAVSTLQVE